ncbi:MAG: DUF1559 domain-containing protein [Planctomycetota bacterium]|nr:DUF1559 domain-containing protein [Planctomycetota bacterium]
MTSWSRITHRYVSHRPGRNGFTMVELLVGIAVVALLIVVLVPAVERAREQSRSVMCQNNQRVLGVAFQQYALDNSQLLPQSYHAGFQAFENAGQAYPEPRPMHEWMVIYHPYIIEDPINPAESTDPFVSPNLLELRKRTSAFDCPSTYMPVGFFHPVTGYKSRPKVFDYIAYPQVKPNSGGQYYKRLDEMPSNLFLISDDRDQDPLYTWGNNSAVVGPNGLAPNQDDQYFVWQKIYMAQGNPAVDGSKGYRPGFHHNNGLNVLLPSGDVRHLTRSQVQPGYATGNYTTLIAAP